MRKCIAHGEEAEKQSSNHKTQVEVHGGGNVEDCSWRSVEVIGCDSSRVEEDYELNDTDEW